MAQTSDGGSTSLRVFICYRRGSSTAYARNIYERLVGRFGEGNVFLDVDDIRPGSDFRAVIAESLGSCDVVLAIIGTDWLLRRNKFGRPRLHNQSDFVYIELVTALD